MVVCTTLDFPFSLGALVRFVLWDPLQVLRPSLPFGNQHLGAEIPKWPCNSLGESLFWGSRGRWRHTRAWHWALGWGCPVPQCCMRMLETPGDLMSWIAVGLSALGHQQEPIGMRSIQMDLDQSHSSKRLCLLTLIIKAQFRRCKCPKAT